MGCQGETVSIQFASADATTAAPVVIYDADGKARPLAANERLLIDHLHGYGQPAAGETPGVGRIDVFADGDGDGVVDAGELIVSFGEGSSDASFGKEGYSVPQGVTPKVLAAAAGEVRVTGSARIIKASTEGVRPAWREAEVV